MVKTEVLANLAFSQNLGAYLENLAGLGLIKVHDDKWLTDSPVYAELEALHRPGLAAVFANIAPFKDRELQFGKGFVQRTSFGANFIAACHAQ